MQRDDYQECFVFKTEKLMIEINHDTICEQCIKNDDTVLAASDEDSKQLGKTVMRRFESQSVNCRN